ncbi:MAG: hypothetical protein EOO67_04055 [Microbacterium sp.]|nr:MAG: hypothetical protein EOO67_04055 [Microbacterium sp.]
MNDEHWSDAEFRSFISALRSDSCISPAVDDTDRERFIRQARLRVAPDVQRRVLADVGAMTDADGIARATLEILEDELWGKRRTWIMVTPDPWGLLADLVTRGIRSSYRASVRRRRDDRALDGIEKVSSRAELAGLDETGDAEADEPARP